ncbi:MAG: short-chain dehydrogenase, partial [Pseudomonadota bacterium]
MKPGRALVTGAGARVGKAMAIALGQKGWRVAVHYNS